MESTVLVAIITGSFSFATFLLTRYFTSKDKKGEKENVQNKKYEELESKEREVQHEVEELKNTINQILQCNEQQMQTLGILSESVKATIRNTIIVMYNKYYVDKKYLPLYERENLSYLSVQYTALEGSGVVPPLIDRLLELPTEPPESGV